MRVFKILLIVIGSVGALLFVSVVALCGYTSHLDDVANAKFAEKAEALQIRGKPEAFVYEHFGAPDFVTNSQDEQGRPYHVLVYTPGPRWSCPYPSYAKIGIGDASGLAESFMINSD